MFHGSIEEAGLALSSPFVQTFTTSCIVLYLGMRSILREKGTAESIAFLKLTVTLAVWLFCFSWMYFSSNESTAMWWAKMAYIGIALMPAAAFEFSAMMLQDYRQVKRTNQFFWVSGMVFIILILVSDLQFSSLYRYTWGVYPKNNLTSIPFIAYFIVGLTIVLLRYLKGFRTARKGSIRRKQAGMMLLAYLTSNIGLVDFLPSFGIPVYPFGFAAIVIFSLILFFSISRYRFVAITPSFAAEEIIGIMDDGLIVLDERGTIKVVNNSFCRMFGLEQSALTGKLLSQILILVPDFGIQLEKAIHEEDAENKEIACLDKDKGIRTFSLAMSIMRDKLGDELAVVCVVREVTEQKRAEKEREQLIIELQEALANIKQLSGLLPICATCKKIRNDKGYWQQIESYISDHTEALFTHGICPPCAEKIYNELEEMKNQKIS